MKREQLLARLDGRWLDFKSAWEGLDDTSLTETALDGWSVKDVIGHLATWEEETLKALPLLLVGKRPPLYRGIDRFNATQVEARRQRSLRDVIEQADAAHARLLRYIDAAPESAFATETRFRHRLRLDTYSHYPEHTEAIKRWRESQRK
jgi:uncharacterized protein (TIGR03083 family)